MASYKAINDVNFFLSRGGNTDDFYKIFKVPYPNDISIDNAIRVFSDTFNCYSKFVDYIFPDPSHIGVSTEDPLENRFRTFALLSGDVFAYLALSIKLAGSAYFSESFAILRSAIDLFLQSLFSSLNWNPSGKVGEWNPLGDILYSPYYDRLEEISLDDVVLDRIGFGEENAGSPVNEIIAGASVAGLEEFYKRLDIDKENIDPTINNEYIGLIRKSLSNIAVKIFKSKEGSYEKKFYLETLRNVTQPENLLSILMENSEYTFRSCSKHKEDLMRRLRNELQIGENDNYESTDALEALTFPFEIPSETHGKVFYCDDCEDPPTNWSIHVRFKLGSMIKYMKYHLGKEVLSEINACSKQQLGLSKSVFFGDLLYKIYGKLNPYSHGDPKTEPLVTEWYEDYYLPVLITLCCVYENLAKQKK